MTSYTDLDNLAWPASRLAEAMGVLARKVGYPVNMVEDVSDDMPPTDESLAAQWWDAQAVRLGVEVEAIETPYAEVETMLQFAGPVLLRLPAADAEPRYLAVLRGTRSRVTVVGPDDRVHHVSLATVRAALCAPVEAPHRAALDTLLDTLNIPTHRRDMVRQGLLREQLSGVHLGNCWMLRLPPGAHLGSLMWHSRLLMPLVRLFGLQVVQQLVLIVAWWVLGYTLLQPQLEWAWLFGWALLMVTIIPLQMSVLGAQAQLSTRISTLFRNRMLYGILRLEPEEVRHQGVGQFLGRVLDIETVELLALNGGFTTLIAIVQVAAAGIVLSWGGAGLFHGALLLVWVMYIVVLSGFFWMHYRNWTTMHRTITTDLIERMVGHRTRLAQEPRDTWHRDEDVQLDRYLTEKFRLNRVMAPLGQSLIHGWLFVGLWGIAYMILLVPTAPLEIVISIAGLVLAFQALTQLSSGIPQLVEAFITSRNIAPLFQAATRPQDIPAVLPNSPPNLVSTGGPPILQGADLMFRYGQRPRPTLRDCTLDIYTRDRILLEGPSGGGKSTLATVLAGLRQPESGLLLLHGYDRHTLGREWWQRQVVLVPQFHENHIITETLAFNLLMGRRWPPQPGDFAEADAICRELGLGDLLDRMPSGLQQMVGEGGWQLSHGERSRLYIARALLQDATLLILDESFAALDPASLSQALTCVLNRAPALVVIAHP